MNIKHKYNAFSWCLIFFAPQLINEILHKNIYKVNKSMPKQFRTFPFSRKRYTCRSFGNVIGCNATTWYCWTIVSQVWDRAHLDKSGNIKNFYQIFNGVTRIKIMYNRTTQHHNSGIRQLIELQIPLTRTNFSVPISICQKQNWVFHSKDIWKICQK